MTIVVDASIALIGVLVKEATGQGPTARRQHAAARAIQFQIADLEKLRNRRLSAEMNLDPRDQLAHKERFDDVIVGPKLQAYDAIGFRSPRRQHHKPALTSLVQRRQPPCGFADAGVTLDHQRRRCSARRVQEILDNPSLG